jgi:hypothetical protein
MAWMAWMAWMGMAWMGMAWMAWMAWMGLDKVPPTPRETKRREPARLVTFLEVPGWFVELNVCVVGPDCPDRVWTGVGFYSNHHIRPRRATQSWQTPFLMCLSPQLGYYGSRFWMGRGCTIGSRRTGSDFAPVTTKRCQTRRSTRIHPTARAMRLAVAFRCLGSSGWAWDGPCPNKQAWDCPG